MFEKRFPAIPAQLFTADGTADGVVTIVDATLFKVKQQIFISSNTQTPLGPLEVKKINTATQLVVGPVSGSIFTSTDISAFLLVDGAAIFANEQKRPSIPIDEIKRSTYEEEPTVAVRSILVNKLGHIYDEDNPLPAMFSGSISVGDLDQGAPNTNPNGWPVKVTDGTNVLGTAAHPIRVDPTGITPQSVTGPLTNAELRASSVGINIVNIPYPSPNFTSSTPLAAGAVFTGAAEDVSGFVNADVTVISDQASANNGLVFSWSQDNVIFDYSESYTVVPNVGQTFSLFARAKYFRVTYTNGGLPQGTFALSTVYYTVSRSTYTHNADLDVPAGNSVDVIKSILAAEKDGGDATHKYTNLKATNEGVLKVAIQTKTSPSTSVPIIVQRANGGPTLTTTTLSKSFPASVTKSNSIVVMVLQGNGTNGATYQLGDTQGNSYTRAGGVNIIGVGSVDAWYSQDVLPGITTVNVFNTSSAVNMMVQIYEVSGLPLDSNPIANLTAGVSITPVTSLSSGTVATTIGNELVISGIAATGGGVITADPGWTQDITAANFLTAERVVTSPSVVSGTATASPGVEYIGLLVTMLPATQSLPIVTDINGVLITNSRSQDGLGNLLTSQASGGQRALDIGINVAGVQVDPRNTRPLTSADVVSVLGPLTDGQLRAAPVPVTFNDSNAPGLTVDHSEITSVASGLETTILTFTAPSGGKRITKADVSGDNIANFRVKVDGTTLVNKRTWWSHFNGSFSFEGFENGLFLTVGQVLTITVIHNSDDLGDFEATLMSI